MLSNVMYYKLLRHIKSKSNLHLHSALHSGRDGMTDGWLEDTQPLSCRPKSNLCRSSPVDCPGCGGGFDSLRNLATCRLLPRRRRGLPPWHSSYNNLSRTRLVNPTISCLNKLLILLEEDSETLLVCFGSNLDLLNLYPSHLNPLECWDHLPHEELYGSQNDSICQSCAWQNLP